MSVYFLQAKSGPIKIGYSSNPKQRTGLLGTLFHESVAVLATVADGTRSLESALHARLERHRLEGEWFSPASEVLACVEAARWTVHPIGDPIDIWGICPNMDAALRLHTLAGGLPYQELHREIRFLFRHSDEDGLQHVGDSPIRSFAIEFDFDKDAGPAKISGFAWEISNNGDTFAARRRSW